MLAGKSRLTRCRSPRTAGAQAHHLLTPIASSFVRCHRLYQTVQTRPEANNRVLRCAAECVPAQLGRIDAVGTRLFSSTSTFALLPGKREREYLQPRNKPRFRKRSEQERQTFAQALKDVQQGHEAEKLPKPSVRSRSQDIDSDTTPCQDLTPSFSSPFFAAPNPKDFVSTSNSPSQSSLVKGTRPPKGFPTLTSYDRQRVSTTELEQELYYIAHNDPHPIAIYNLLKILIHDRGIKPGSQHYEALLLANCWPEYGSVHNVERILAEMGREGIEIGANIIFAVLKVLAVHPSAELSHEMLTVAERRWLQSRPPTHHHSVLALLRTGQTELAEWKLDALRMHSRAAHIADKDVIPDYLTVLLMAEMARTEDWEGILRYMYKLRNRRASDREIPAEFWGWVLEKAAKAARNIVEQSQHITESHNRQNGPNQASLTVQGDQSSNDSPNPTLSHDQSATMEPLPSSSNLSPSLHRQLSLYNPAKHLTEYIWSLYVEPMSFRPSWTTCLDLLHIAASTGTAWLATSTLAVMTYVDGVTATGKPKTHIPHEIHELVRLAQAKHEAAKDPAVEEARQRREIEDQRKKSEYQAWWADLMQKLDEKEANLRGTRPEQGRVEQQPALGSEAQQDPQVPKSSAGGKADRRAAGLLVEEYIQDQRNRPPPPNLWPAFPHFDGVGSAHVDAWTALGPRSSSRGKWTEAQEYYRWRDKNKKK